MCLHTAALACVAELKKSIYLRHFFDSSGDLVSKNAVNSRKDARHVARLCRVFAELEKGYSYPFLQTISAQRPRYDNLVEKRLEYQRQVTGTLHCLELSYACSTDLSPEQGPWSLPCFAVA